MEEWKGNLSTVREIHEKLLLFMIPKLKILEEILCRRHSTDEVGRELIYLCESCQPSINVCNSPKSTNFMCMLWIQFSILDSAYNFRNDAI